MCGPQRVREVIRGFISQHRRGAECGGGCGQGGGALPRMREAPWPGAGKISWADYKELSGGAGL